MAKTMKITAILSLLLTIVCTLLHIKTENDILFTLAITFGTIAYHFCMRLLVGEVINALLHNKVDYNKKWFKVGKTEQVILIMDLNMIQLRLNNMLLNMKQCELFKYGLIYDSLPS